jgi:hypothetical protein
MPISTGDATAAINALAGVSTDPSARVAANRGARASVISLLGYPGNVEGAHHDLARSLFNNTEVQDEDDIPSQHMSPLTREPPFDAVHFDVPDGASVTTAANQQVYKRSALFRCIATQGTLSVFWNIFHPLTRAHFARTRALSYVLPVSSSLLVTLHRERLMLNLPLEDDNPLNDDDRALYEQTMISCAARCVYLLCFLYLT